MPVSASGDMRGALLERDADLVGPVDVVGRRRDEAERQRGVGVERLADARARAASSGRGLAVEAALQPRSGR